jgi:hypothetical protein
MSPAEEPQTWQFGTDGLEPYPMPRSEMFETGRLRQVEEATRAPEPHGFDKVSREARCNCALSHRAFRVLATLEGYCFGDDRESWACNRTIGAKSGGIGPNAVRLALRELERHGYLEIVPDDRKFRGSRLRLLYTMRGPAGSEVYDDRE